jgi:hypothetical protein
MEKEPKKDIIYIDTDDDITSVVAKIKRSEGELIELVPPKRAGFLQSAVSMKLIQRTAKKSDKAVALVTGDKGLAALAGAAGVGVARNLREEPVLPDAPEKDEAGEDVIDGDDLNVHQYAPDESEADDAPRGRKNMSGEDKDIEVALRRAEDDDDSEKGEKRGRPPKAPNFNKFRKWIFIGGGAAIILIAFLVWAIGFAPHATITITAATSSISVNKNIVMGEKITTDSSKNALQSTTKTEKKDATASGTATGSRDDGTVASGTATLKCVTGDICVVRNNVTIDGNNYAVSNSGAQVSNGDTVDVTITAPDKGEKYNVAADDVTGASFGHLTATTSNGITGGTSKIVKIVTDVDVRNAVSSLKTDADANTVKSELAKQFGSEYVVIDDSLTSTAGDPVAVPAVNQPTDSGTFKITVTTTYSLTAVAKSELANFLKPLMDAASKENASQKVYDYGTDSAKFTNFSAGDNGASATISAAGKIGPNIDTDKVASDYAGKKAMEVTEGLKEINNVSNVDVKFSPFWVSSVPNDANKVDVKLNSAN